jgi:ATP-binding protein involved in chromosome partitioning
MTELRIPKQIHRGERDIAITWDDDHEGLYPARDLRLRCQCARCRDEMTGVPLIDPAAVPEDISPLKISLVGSYAIRIDWNDGHSTGIYTYDFLHAICPCEECSKGSGELGAGSRPLPY